MTNLILISRKCCDIIIKSNFAFLKKGLLFVLKIIILTRRIQRMKKYQRALSLLLALLMIISSVLFTLTSCDNGGGGGEGTGGEGSGNQGGGGSEGEGDTAYTVTVATVGGMEYSNLPVYLYSYENGRLGSYLSYTVTDANGVAKFMLDSTKGYAVKIDAGLPEGYDFEEYYPLIGVNTKITLSSALIDGDLSSATLGLGDIMYDFTVTKIDGTKFTLSEALAEYDMVLLNFWYTDCSWCLTEFPIMNTVYGDYKDKIAIIAIDPIDDMADIKSFYNSFDTDTTTDTYELLTFDVASDDDALLAMAFGIENYPTSVVIDRYGMISLIEEGAITSQKPFTVIFDHFTATKYDQQVITDINDMIERTVPNVEMPSSDEISDAFDGGNLDVTYRNDEDDVYSWPFTITEKEGVTCLVSTNGGEDSSYSQLITSIELNEGDVLAFDYFSSTEGGCDLLYFVVDGKDMYSISGISTEWESCYSYVAPEDGTYEIAFIYNKDTDSSEGEDKVFISNFRVVSIDDIDTPSYIFRYAATKPNYLNKYEAFITPVFNENDGYYHVNSADGPILLADMMGYTRFSDESSVYLYSIGTDIADAVEQYANYSVNSQFYGLCSVNEELKEYLIAIAAENGRSEQTAWLEFCCYYNAYGTGGEELSDPIAGLAPHSAYDAILSETGDTDFPNVVTYDRLIMPRGLFHKFTPEESGVYLVISNSASPVDAWVFLEEDFEDRYAHLTYTNVARGNTDETNCYMIAYFEAGEDYYINVALRDNTELGKLSFRLERLGDEGYYRFSSASPGPFTTILTPTGGFGKIITGGIDVVLGTDGYWREKVNEGEDRIGSLLYAEITMTTELFSDHTIAEIVERGGFDFSMTEVDEFVVGTLDKYIEEGKTLNEAIELVTADLRAFYAEEYEDVIENNNVDGIFEAYRNDGYYVGVGIDYTEYVRSYIAANLITEENIGDDDPAKIGCVVVNEEFAKVLQLLVDKYSLAGVENSWVKLCYYTQYFGPDSPV